MNSLVRLTAIVILLVGILWGQNDGTPTFGLQKSFGIDTVDLVTLTPELTIPIYSQPGMLPSTPQLELSESCQIIPYPFNNGQSWEDKASCATQRAWSVNNYGYYRYYYTPYSSGSCAAYEYFNIQGGDLTIHTFGLSRVWYTSTCGPTSGTFTATDDSGWQLYATVTTSGLSVTAYDASGNSVSVLCGGCSGTAAFKDPYGNTASEVISGNTVSWTDEYGIAAPTLTNSGTASEALTWINSTGGNEQLTETYGSSQNMSSNFHSCVYVQESGSITPLTSLNFPDGSTIGFSWEQGPASGTLTGRLGGYTTRQGGTVTYSYSNDYCVITGSGKTVKGYLYPGTLTRTDADGTWTFSMNWVCNTNVETTTVLDPGQNKTVYTFTGFFPAQVSPCGGTTEASASPNLTQVQVYQNTGTVSSPVYSLLETIVYCYNGNTSSCPTTVVTPFAQITERDTYTTLGSMSNSSRIQELYDSYGNTTSVARYDFGASSPTRTTTTSYGNWNGTACVSIGSYIQNRSCDTKTYDGTSSGVLLSETRNTYDTHGGLTKTQSWTGSTWESTSYTRNPNGTAATMTPPYGSATSYGYAATGSGGCNQLLLTSTTTGSLTTSQTWNCNGAVVLTQTDENNQITITSYNDPFFRVTSVTDPMGNETTTQYTSPTQTTVTPPGGYGNVVTTVDGLGRLTDSQIQKGPGATTYDTQSFLRWFENGYWAQIKNTPCVTTIAALCPTTNHGKPAEAYTLSDTLQRTVSVYDALQAQYTVTSYTNQDSQSVLYPAPSGEHLKTVQQEVNGVGQLTSTCKLLTSGGASCGEVIGGSGIVDTYAYTYASGSATTKVTRGSEQKTTVIDGIGRTISAVTPEQGTVTSVFDLATSTCTTAYSGHLVARQTGLSTECLSYDTYNRLVQQTYYVNSTASHCSYFVFGDTSPTVPSGSGITYSYGNNRVVNAYTSETCGGRSGLSVDEWFSYNKDGHITDVWESTPQSGGYYHTSATYDARGTITSLHSPALFATQYFSLDNQGRVNGANLGAGSPEMSNGAFDAAGKVISGTIGGSDSEAFTYDNDERMSTWTYTVGSASQTGTVYYNGNGTLSEVAIGDGFNAGGTETCYYNPSLATGSGYDDVGRLVGVNCGSLWTQAYSYDQYDNITESGSLSWACAGGCYNTKNQYTTVLAGTVSYDAAGDVTNDGINSYTWYPDQKLEGIVSSGTLQCGVSGYCALYDAYGLLAQTSGGSSFTEYLISPVGTVAKMNGQTTVTLRLPLSGGELLLTNSNLYFGFGDWLGSARIFEQINTGGAGTVVKDTAFSPYGYSYDTVIDVGDYGPVDLDFIGLFQDIAPGTNIFDTANRELPVGQARWLSPDPANSSWNAYVYVTDPNSFIDPSGLDCVNSIDGHVVEGDCEGKDPNHEFYVDCDGCLQGIRFVEDENGNLVGLESHGSEVSVVAAFLNNGDLLAPVNGKVKCSGECLGDVVTVNGGSTNVNDLLSIIDFSLRGHGSTAVMTNGYPHITPEQAEYLCSLTATLGLNGSGGGDTFHFPDAGRASPAQGQLVWDNTKDTLPTKSLPAEALNPAGAHAGEGAGGAAVLAGYVSAHMAAENTCLELYKSDVARGYIVPHE